MKVLKALYINHLFFYILAGIGGLFFVSFFATWLFTVAWVLFTLLLIVTIVDIFMLFSGKNGLEAERILPDKLSNGDENPIVIGIKNNYPAPLS